MSQARPNRPTEAWSTAVVNPVESQPHILKKRYSRKLTMLLKLVSVSQARPVHPAEAWFTAVVNL